MKKISKILKLFVILFFFVFMTGCGDKNIDLSTSEIIDKIYGGIDDLPQLQSIELTNDNLNAFLGIDSLKFIEGTISEPLISSIPFSVVAVKVENGVDVDKVADDIKNNVNPRKWICVEADDVRVLKKGNTILLLMMNLEDKDITDKMENNFMNL